jgi:O-antigen/teichoic acid export membrane protein
MKRLGRGRNDRGRAGVLTVGGAEQGYFARPEISSLRTKAVKGGGVNVVSAMISFAIQTVGVIVLGRLLKPGDFGVVTMVTAFTVLLMNFGFNGFTEYIIQRKSLDEKELTSIFWLHALISLGMMAGFAALGPALAGFYNEPAIGPIVAVMSAGILAQMLSTVQFAILKRKMEFGKLAVNNILAGGLSSVLAVVMALKGFGHWAVVWRQLSSVAFATIGVWLICPWRPGVPRGLGNAIPGLKYALRLYGAFTVTYVSKSLDKILLGRFYGSDVLGNYDRAYYLSSMPFEQIATPLSSVGLATLSRLKDDTERYSSYYKKALCTLAFIGVFASVLLTVSGRDFVRVLLGPNWSRAGSVAAAFGPGVGALILYSTTAWVHLSLGKPERWLRFNIVFLAVIAGLLAVTARWGPVFVAAAFSGAYIFLLVPSLWYAGRPIDQPLAPLVKGIAPYFGAGLLTCVILLGLSTVWAPTAMPFQALPVAVRIVVSGVLSGLLYTGFVVMLSRSLDPVKDFLSSIQILLSRDKPDPSEASGPPMHGRSGVRE